MEVWRKEDVGAVLRDAWQAMHEEDRGFHSPFRLAEPGGRHLLGEEGGAVAHQDLYSRNVWTSFASVSLSSPEMSQQMAPSGQAFAGPGPGSSSSQAAGGQHRVRFLSDGKPFQWNLNIINWEFRLPFFGDATRREALTALNHVYAGTMARTFSQVICHPVDTVKTRMQIKDPTKKLRKWRKKIHKKAIGIGPLDIDNWLVKGPGDVYRGVWGAILGTIPNAAVYFVAYESSKRKISKYLPPDLTHVCSAAVGVVASSVIRVPMDTVKHRVQAFMHANVFEAAVSVIRAEGVGGLYKGFIPTLMRDVPEIAIQFAVYEKLRSFMERRQKKTKLTTPEHLFLGAFAGAVAAACTVPLDLVKTRQQCGMAMSIPRILGEVLAEAGPLGLLAGLGPRAMHVSMMSAVFFTLFEYGKQYMKPDREPGDKEVKVKIWTKRREKIWKRQFVYTE